MMNYSMPNLWEQQRYYEGFYGELYMSFSPHRIILNFLFSPTTEQRETLRARGWKFTMDCLFACERWWTYDADEWEWAEAFLGPWPGNTPDTVFLR